MDTSDGAGVLAMFYLLRSPCHPRLIPSRWANLVPGRGSFIPLTRESPATLAQPPGYPAGTAPRCQRAFQESEREAQLTLESPCAALGISASALNNAELADKDIIG